MNYAGAEAERRVRRHYRLRGYRIVETNIRAGGNELDLVARRGGRLVVCEVKMRRDASFGDASEAVRPEKERRVRRAAEAFLARRPDLAGLEVALELAAVRGTRIERLEL
jgi:putative endonuclease